MMDLYIQLITSIIGCIMLLLSIWLLRKNRIREGIALLWLVAAFFVVSLALISRALPILAQLSALSPPFLALGTCVGFLGLLSFFLTFRLSKQKEQIRMLAQETALLRARVQEMHGPSPFEGETVKRGSPFPKPST